MDPATDSRPRALVIDDPVGLGLLLALALDELGFAALVVHDGAAALARLSARPRELALAIFDPADAGVRVDGLAAEVPLVLLRERGPGPRPGGPGVVWLERPLSRRDLVDALIAVGALPLPARAGVG